MIQKNSKIPIAALAKKHGTPLFILSRSKLAQQVKRFRALLPRVRPCYAVKDSEAVHVDLVDVAFNAKGVEQVSLGLEVDYRVSRDDTRPAIAQIDFTKAHSSKHIHHGLMQDLYNGVTAQVTPGTEISRLDRDLVRKLIARLLLQLYPRHRLSSRAILAWRR